MTPCQGLERESRSRARAEPDEHAIPDKFGGRVSRRSLERVVVCASVGGTHGSTAAATALTHSAIVLENELRFIGTFPCAESARIGPYRR
jgi:hypothetical protein